MSARRSTGIVALLAAGALHAAAFAAAQAPAPGPGLHTATLDIHGRSTLGYAISIPPGGDRTTRMPLVLALHFGVQGGSSLYAGRDLIRLLVGPALADLGAILVAPDALNGGPWSTPENEDAVLLLVDSVMRSYAIDPKKVIVTGFSMGGAGTWHFAGKYPDRFSAAVPVAGRPPSTAAGWRVPVFAVHSRSDRVVPIDATEKRIDELKRAGVNAELVVLESPTHYQTRAHVEGLKAAVRWLDGIWK
jgi:predicted peptidase